MINDSEIMGYIGFGDDNYSTPYNIFETGPSYESNNTKCSGIIENTDEIYYKKPCSSGCNISAKKCDTNPYLPIEMEPMGRDYNPYNFQSSYPSRNYYNYNPLTYKTPARSYFDAWPSGMEFMSNSPGKSGSDFHILLIIFIFLIIIITFAYLQNKQINSLRDTVKDLLTKK